MLTVLRISGFALIDELELELGPGLTVITGETGAGKSIIIEALGLLRGGRAGADLIRVGRDEARVEAIIDLPAAAHDELRARLEADGRQARAGGQSGDDGGGDDDGLVVRRTVARSGRGRAHLGGALATAGDLASTVAGLIDIASQHDQQSLTDGERQLAILDAFAENDALRVTMAAAHRALAAASQALDAFSADARTRTEREDLLRFQMGELEAAALAAADEDVELRGERERLKSAEKLFAAAARGEEVLYAQEAAVAGQIAGVARELAGLGPIDPALGALAERLQAAQATVEDVARDLGRYASRVRADPARLAEVEERLFLLARLARKHGGTLADAIARREAIARELAELGSFDDGLERRRAALAAAEAAARAAAEALTRSRRKAAGGLEKKVAETLRELGLTQARLPVLVEPRAGGEGTLAGAGAIGATGADRVRFLFAPNPGEEPRPLAKIASGGELSRVMLAVKQALAKTDRVLTYVFDEVDSGVGGGTAETIGRKLKKIAAERQVIAITHLPQIAVFVDAHIRVTKTSAQGRTRVAVEGVSGAERTREIARMLGGATPSAEATAHAGEMLRRARA
jgi:DNA repair protein RecN (Recombination protein N)